MCSGQRTAFSTQFFPFTVWPLLVKRLPGLAASGFTHWTPSPVLCVLYFDHYLSQWFLNNLSTHALGVIWYLTWLEFLLHSLCVLYDCALSLFITLSIFYYAGIVSSYLFKASKCAYCVSCYSMISRPLDIISPSCCSCFVSHVEFCFSKCLFIFYSFVLCVVEQSFRSYSTLVSSRSLGGSWIPVQSWC